MRINKHHNGRKFFFSWRKGCIFSALFLISVFTYYMYHERLKYNTTLDFLSQLPNKYFINDHSDRTQLLFYFPIGFYDAPVEYSTTAHLMEHLFFYQNENFLKKIVSKGGVFYAETRGHLILFYFDIPSSLRTFTISYLNAFLNEPIFNEKDIIREIKVITNEESRFTNPIYDVMEIIRKNSNPTHPFHAGFSSKPEKLAQNIVLTKKLIEDYHHHFRKDNLYLIIKSDTKFFHKLKERINHNKTRNDIKKVSLPEEKKRPSIFREKHLLQEKYFTPILNNNKLFLFYPLNQKGTSNLITVIDNLKFLLNLKGQDGLYHKLFTLGFITDFEVSFEPLDIDQQLLCFEFSLTDLGLTKIPNIEKILQQFFLSANKLTLPNAFSQKIYQTRREREMQIENIFSPDSLIHEISLNPINLHTLFEKNSLTKEDLSEVNVLFKELTKKLSDINPGKIYSKKNNLLTPARLKEKKYVSASNGSFDFASLQKVFKESSFSMETDLKPEKTEYYTPPTLIKNTNGYQLWYKPSKSKNKSFNFSLSLSPSTTLKNRIGIELFAEALRFHLGYFIDISTIENKEFSLFATELGSIHFKLDSSINNYDKDFRILFNTLSDFTVSKALFNKIKLAFVEKNREQKSIFLHQHPMKIIQSFISEESPYQIDEKELYAYSYKDFLDFIHLTSFDELISFIHGDCPPEILHHIDNLLSSFFQKSIKMGAKKNTVTQWPINRENISIEKTDIDPSFVIFNFILNETNSRKLALLYLSKAYIEEKIFFFLREKLKEPIYYYEIATVDDGLQFLFRDTSYPLNELRNMLTSFLKEQYENINYISFLKTKIASEKDTWFSTIPFQRLNQKYWLYITHPLYEINHRAKIKDEKKEITYHEFKAFLHDLFIENNHIQIISNMPSSSLSSKIACS